MSGSATKAEPWELKTPPGSSEYTMHREEASGPPSLVWRSASRGPAVAAGPSRSCAVAMGLRHFL